MAIRKLEPLIRDILETDEKARDNDDYLFVQICKQYISHWKGLDLNTFFFYMENNAVPNYRSVTRCRSKLQELNEDLRGKMYGKRKEQGEKVKEELLQWKEVNKNQGDLF